ncbi:MAG: recombinase family protein, partial [Candidatus Omnitrophica bacterium]|nr:recombinase family protein [Candidatus Omnitrophota bacterium]
MKVIIYARVSTKEQAEQGYSLEAQEIECRRFATANGYEVDACFVERGESAKTQNRTELQKLIKYAIQNKKKLTALIIWKYDRLARNLSDQIELVKCFSAVGMRVLSATENNEDNSTGR